MANFDDYQEISDSNLFGDREERFKIWRLPDYPGELTALRESSTGMHLVYLFIGVFYLLLMFLNEAC